MTSGDRAFQLAEALIDRVQSQTALLPGAKEKWAVLICEQIEDAVKEEAANWATTVTQAREARDCADLQVDAWKRYHALLSEELDSAIGVAWVHGWRSTPEKIEAGKRLRAELGLPDNELDAVIKARETEKRVCEKCKGNYHTGPCDPRCEIHGLEFCEACKYPF